MINGDINRSEQNICIYISVYTKQAKSYHVSAAAHAKFVSQ